MMPLLDPVAPARVTVRLAWKSPALAYVVSPTIEQTIVAAPVVHRIHLNAAAYTGRDAVVRESDLHRVRSRVGVRVLAGDIEVARDPARNHLRRAGRAVAPVDAGGVCGGVARVRAIEE